MKYRNLTLAIALVPGALAVSGCGSSDQDKIKNVITTTEYNPKDWCTTKYVTQNFIASVGGEQKCLKSFVKGKGLVINSIQVNGSTAIVKATDSTGPGTANLVKQSGDWKIDSAHSGQ